MTAQRRAGLVVDGSAPLWLGGLAGSGIVAAHCLAYALAEPHGHDRAMLMDATGHRFWSVVAAISLGLGLAGVAAFLARTVHPAAGARRVDLFGFAVSRLMALQVGGFVLLEVSERFFFGHGISSLPAERAFVAGVVLQIVVAVVSSLLLSVVARTLRALMSGGPLSSSSRTRGEFLRSGHSWMQPSLVLGTGAGTWRGPPADS
jgi:hypothetical protein